VDGATEPGALDVGHVPDESVQAHEGRRHGASPTPLVVEPLALEQQGHPLPVEPSGIAVLLVAVDHGRIRTARVVECFDHRDSLAPTHRAGPAITLRPCPGTTNRSLTRCSTPPRMPAMSTPRSAGSAPTHHWHGTRRAA